MLEDGHVITTATTTTTIVIIIIIRVLLIIIIIIIIAIGCSTTDKNIKIVSLNIVIGGPHPDSSIYVYEFLMFIVNSSIR